MGYSATSFQNIHLDEIPLTVLLLPTTSFWGYMTNG